VVLDGTPGDHLGVSVDGIDIDGDGLSDILAGAPSDASAPVGSGKVYVTLGAENVSGPAAMTLTGQSEGSLFGRLVAAAGDMNGDGLGDFAVVAPEAAGGTSSEISVFLGAAGNLGVPLKFSGAGATSFGTCAAGGGDLEDDGFDDLLVCAPDAASDNGELHIVRGAAMTTEIAIELLESGTVADANYASGASFVDDFNGDAKDDVVVGAVGIDGGTVFLYYGGLASLVESDTAVGDDSNEPVGHWVD
jgi:hypothetical protein